MDNRNLILAIVLSIGIMLTYDLFFNTRTTPVAPPPQAQSQDAPKPETARTATDAPLPPGPGGETAATTATQPAAAANGAAPSRAQALAKSNRVRIESPRLSGSVALVGGRIDDIVLTQYREKIAPDSANIVLLSPLGAPQPYVAEFGWVATSAVPMPGPTTTWTADRPVLLPDAPVTLSWDNGAGLVFKRTIALDRSYMFTVTDRVENKSAAAVTLHPYGLILRRGMPHVLGFFIMHEGPLGVFHNTLREIDYEKHFCLVFCKDYLKGGSPVAETTTGGWIGITDKYWLAALVPDQSVEVQTRMTHRPELDDYQVDFRGPAQPVAPGATAESTSRLFAGAKEVVLLDDYAERLGIARFDLAIDFGWFYFLTKPIFYVLIYLTHGAEIPGIGWVQGVGNFGVAILLLTVLIKLIFFPLANKSYKAMSKMKKLQPEMLKLRERFGEDRMKFNQEVMALYKREKANPASGCLPMIVQIPVFFALYKCLFVTIEMRQAPFFGWIHDLSQPDPTTLFNLFGLLPFTPPDMLMVGVWPIIMGASMYLQQLLNPQPADPVQAKLFLVMPLVFTFILAPFPAGLVIYWVWNNVLSVLQQWTIMKRMGVSPTA